MQRVMSTSGWATLLEVPILACSICWCTTSLVLVDQDQNSETVSGSETRPAGARPHSLASTQDETKEIVEGTDFCWDVLNSPGLSIESKLGMGLSSAHATFGPFTPPSKDDKQAGQTCTPLSVPSLFAPALTS